MQTQLSLKEIKTIKAIRSYFYEHNKMPSTRTLMRLLTYKSPRSVTVLINNLVDKELLIKKENGSYKIVDFSFSEDFGTREQTINIPLIGDVACGLPIFANENIEAEVPVSVRLIKKGFRYFLLRAKGNSMNNAGINNGDLVLIRQQQQADNGDHVVALIDDEATIKEYHHNGSLVVLKPKSKSSKYQPIILSNDFRIQGVVEAVIAI